MFERDSRFNDTKNTVMTAPNGCRCKSKNMTNKRRRTDYCATNNNNQALGV